MKATLIDRASEMLRKAIDDAKKELASTTDPDISQLRPSELVWRKIQSGQEWLHDPENTGDMLILTMASYK
jgi:hypothetical protein